DSRTFWTAGRSKPMRMAMIAITTSSSISVKPRQRRREGKRFIEDSLLLSSSGALPSKGRRAGGRGSGCRTPASCPTGGWWCHRKSQGKSVAEEKLRRAPGRRAWVLPAPPTPKRGAARWRPAVRRALGSHACGALCSRWRGEGYLRGPAAPSRGSPLAQAVAAAEGTTPEHRTFLLPQKGGHLYCVPTARPFVLAGVGACPYTYILQRV